MFLYFQRIKQKKFFRWEILKYKSYQRLNLTKIQIISHKKRKDYNYKCIWIKNLIKSKVIIQTKKNLLIIFCKKMFYFEIMK